MKKELTTDIERNNKLGMTAHFIIALIMCTFCFLQTTSGLQTLGYAFLMLFLGLAPVAAEFYYWKKDTQTSMIKHLMAIGFAVFYTVALFTSTNNLVFVFVIPMILVASVFNDTRYSLLINTGTIIESLLVIILGAKTGGFGYAGRDSAVIQMVIMIVLAIYSYLTNRTLNENLTHKLNHIQSISRKTDAAIEQLHEELEQLNESSHTTKLAMADVSTGTTDTATAVQEQLLQTETIHQQIDAVNASAALMSQHLNETLHFIENGNHDVTQLKRNADASIEISSQAVEKLNTLQKHMEEMNSISKLIDEIAFQINIMALNANVEAARAGESGRGFAVVASQISDMSLKTKHATENISVLIDNVSQAISQVVSVMYEMIEDIGQGQQFTADTFDSFSSIQKNTEEISKTVDELIRNITHLTDANFVICNSIETISAASQQVSALAGEAMNSESQNAQVLDSISEQMQMLLKDIHSNDIK